jgi:putative aldouronate transport system permease protein
VSQQEARLGASATEAGTADTRLGQPTAVSRVSRSPSVITELIHKPHLYLLALPGILYFFCFNYLPMPWIVAAFMDFRAGDGFFGLGSKWVGFENFVFFFTSGDLGRIVFNTVFLNFLFITSGLVVSVTLALLLNELTNPAFKRVCQSLTFFPFFLSGPVMAMVLYGMVNYDTGSLNFVLEHLGQERLNPYADPAPWPVILTFLSLWQGMGANAIIYLAALVGIDPLLYEAARIDGANRWDLIRRVSLPLLRPTMIVLTLLSLGRIFYGAFNLIYPIMGDNAVLFPTMDIIDTYVFRALRTLQDAYGMVAAVGLSQSLVGLVVVVVANWLARRYSAREGESMFLF